MSVIGVRLCDKVTAILGRWVTCRNIGMGDREREYQLKSISIRSVTNVIVKKWRIDNSEYTWTLRLMECFLVLVRCEDVKLWVYVPFSYLRSTREKEGGWEEETLTRFSIKSDATRCKILSLRTLPPSLIPLLSRPSLSLRRQCPIASSVL